jgi:hypothetical protein
MTVGKFLMQRNENIIARYKKLRLEKITGTEAKQIISAENEGLFVHTIEQVIYNEKYSNSSRGNE